MKIVTFVFLFFLSTSCITLPPVYLYDKETIMEIDASADWGDIEKEFFEEILNEGTSKIKSKGLSKIEAFNMINGSFTSSKRN